MFGKYLDMSAKRDMVGGFSFFLAHLVILVGISSVLMHFLSMIGMVDGSAGSFFEGGETYTLIGTLFTMWLGGMVLTKRGLTSDTMSIIIVMAGVYLAWTSSVVLGLVPIALLTTINK
jgi:hypothetical protein